MGGFDGILWDGALWGGDADPADSSVAASVLLGRLYPRLHSDTAANLVWWTDTELLEWIDRSLKRLARTCGAFLKRTATATANGVATYALPPEHVSTKHVAVNNVPLHASSATELAARDDSYGTTPATVSAPVSRWYQDELGVTRIGLHPVPIAVETLALIHHYNQSVAAGGDTIAAPQVFMSYLEDSALSAAYGKESDASMVEVTRFLDTKTELFEAVAKKYWGTAA